MDHHIKKYQLDEDEVQILNGIEAGRYTPVPNIAEEVDKAQIAAQNTMERLKNKNINIRMAEGDIKKIKQKASTAGLPYQTLIAAILHQYAMGKLKVQI